MLRRLTDLWPNLLRSSQRDQSDDEEPLLGEEENGDRGENGHEIDEEQLLEDYRNLYWTRLMNIQDYEVDQDRKYPLGPDIVEECRAVAEAPQVNLDEWSPLFDPEDFNKEHGPLLIEDFRLPQDDLRAWAERAVKL